VFSHAFFLQLLHQRLVDAGLAASTFVFSDWLSIWCKLSSAVMTSLPHIMHQGPYGPCYTQPLLRMLHGFCNRKMTPSWYLPTRCIRFCNYLVQQFRDGDLRQPEVLVDFSIIIFLKQMPPWQNDAFASLIFLFTANKKPKKLCRYAIVNRPLKS